MHIQGCCADPTSAHSPSAVLASVLFNLHEKSHFREAVSLLRCLPRSKMAFVSA